MVYVPAPSTDTAEKVAALMKSSRTAGNPFEAASGLEKFKKSAAVVVLGLRDK